MSLRNRISRARVTAGLLALLAAAQTSAAPPGWAGDVHALGYSPAHMDRRVSPRQDFYRYAIGNWLANTPIPASATDIGGFSELAVSIDAQLVRLIQQAAGSAAEAGTPRQQVGDYWLAAMDLQRLDVLGLAPLQADLQRLASLPLRDAAALGEFSARLQRDYGASPLLNLAVAPDAKDSKRYLLNVLGGLQTLNPDEYLKPEGQPMRDLYKAHMVRMFEAAGDATPAAEAAARSVLAIEAELAAAQMSPIQRLNQSLIYNLLSPAEAQLLLPALDLAALFKTHGISAPAQLQVRDLGVVRALNKVLTERPADEVRHLLRWHLLTARASLLGQPWRDLDPVARIELLAGLKVFQPPVKAAVERARPVDPRTKLARLLVQL